VILWHKPTQLESRIHRYILKTQNKEGSPEIDIFFACTKSQTKLSWARAAQLSLFLLCVLFVPFNCAEFGGIYLDPDVLVLRSFDPLRRLPLTLGRQTIKPPTIANGIIICRPGVVFLRLWLETYKTYNPRKWDYHSVQIPAMWACFSYTIQ